MAARNMASKERIVASDAGCNPLGVSQRTRLTRPARIAEDPRQRKMRLYKSISLKAGNRKRTVR
jgi:hypothetical protein